MSRFGGRIRLKAPVWYDSAGVGDDEKERAFIGAGSRRGAPTECESGQVTITAGVARERYLELQYTVPNPAALPASITLRCEPWSAPIRKGSIGGYEIEMYLPSAAGGELMADTGAFALDTTGYAAHPIPPSSISFGPLTGAGAPADNSKVQASADYELRFDSPVPLEFRDVNARCYLRLTFPDDFGVPTALATVSGRADTKNRFRHTVRLHSQP